MTFEKPSVHVVHEHLKKSSNDEIGQIDNQPLEPVYEDKQA